MSANSSSGIALLRGINVGRAKRIAMADLRSVFEELGFTEVRTVLNSGNVVFGSAPRQRPPPPPPSSRRWCSGSAWPRA